MCGRCIIYTYDEVLRIIKQIEVSAPVNVEPDWPARRPPTLFDGLDGFDDEASRAASYGPQAYPDSIAPLIVPRFDTAERPFAIAAPRTFDAEELKWGFQETWKPGVVFNTRIESASKPLWEESMQHRRCILPVSAFFETHRDETYPSPRTGKPIKRQYEFRVPGRNVILIGCIRKDGRFSMVTTEANADMAPIHHRMPLIVRQEELPLWFGPDFAQLADRSDVRLEAERATS